MTFGRFYFDGNHDSKALADEKAVINQLTQQSQSHFAIEHNLIDKSIVDDNARLATIEKMIAKLYEDMITERISAEIFNTILAKTQAEQKALRERLIHSQNRLDCERQEQGETARWIELIKEYAEVRELNSVTLQWLIKRIAIYENIDGGIIRQTVEIHFNFMGQPDKYKLIRE